MGKEARMKNMRKWIRGGYMPEGGGGVDNWENYCEVEPRSDAEDAAILAKVVSKIVE